MGRQRSKYIKKKYRPSQQNPSIRTSHPNEKSGDKNCILDESQVCSNCCTPIDSSTNKTKEIASNSSQHKSSTCSNDVSVDDPSTSSYDVNKMLSTIYNLDFIPRLLQKYPDGVPGEMLTDIITDLPLCFLCTNLLKSLFFLYTQFNQIRKVESLLSQQIKALNLLINYDDQNLNQQLNPNDKVADDSRGAALTSISVTRDEVSPQAKAAATTRTNTNSSSGGSSRIELNSTDPGLSASVKIVPLDDLTVEDIGYAPPSLCHLYQDTSQGTSTSARRQETVSQLEIGQQRTTASCHSNSTKIGKVSSSDRGPWVKVGPRLEELTIEEEEEDSGYDPLTFSNLCQETPQSNLIIPGVSIAPAQNDEEDDEEKESDTDNEPSFLSHDDDMDYEPSLSSLGVDDANDVDFETSSQPDFDDEDVKPALFDIRPDLGLHSNFESWNILGKSTNGKSTLAVQKQNSSAEEKENRPKQNQKQPVKRNQDYEKDSDLDNPVKFDRNEKKRKQVPRERKFECMVATNEGGRLCPFSTTSARYLKNHMLNVHAEEKDKVKCGQCDKVLKNKRCLNVHNFNMHTENGRKAKEKEHPCTIIVNKETGQVCPYRAMYAHNLKIHMLSVHTEAKDKAKCYICKKKLKSKFHLKEHMNRMHNDNYKKPNKEKLPCTFIDETGKVCPYQGDAKALTRHMAGFHVEEKDKVKCEECNKEFKSKFHLKGHVQRIHSEKGRKWYKLQLEKLRAKTKARKKEMKAKAKGKTTVQIKKKPFRWI